MTANGRASVYALVEKGASTSFSVQVVWVGTRDTVCAYRIQQKTDF